MGRHLLLLELREEWRMLSSYFSSEKLFFIFPAVLFFLGFLTTLLSPLFERAFDTRELLLAFHLLLALYGVFVGGFGFFADEVATRWFGETRLLLHMHAILPISFRRIFLFFYVKDIIYYLLLTIYPLFLGALLSFNVPLDSFFVVLLSSTLSFLTGISLSFFLSSIYVRSKAVLIGAMLVMAFLGLRASLWDFPPLTFLLNGDLLSLAYSLVIFVVFSGISLALAAPKEKAEREQVSQTDLFLRLDPLLAKEILDIKRSKTYRIIATSYLFPLFFLYGIFYFTQRLLDFRLEVPLVFYAGFLGYLGTLVYSWLNTMDSPSSMTTLPITVSQLVKRKIVLFLAASFLVSVVYLFLLGYLMRDMKTLPLSFFCMGATTFYVASVTAYLCGLHPNTLLFDGTILAKYLASILPVLILSSILSLMKAYAAIYIVSFIVLLLSFFIYGRLDNKFSPMLL